MQEGEKFTLEELSECFNYLVGKRLFREAIPNEIIIAEEFESDLLGFEEYDEDEEEA